MEGDGNWYGAGGVVRYGTNAAPKPVYQADRQSVREYVTLLNLPKHWFRKVCHSDFARATKGTCVAFCVCTAATIPAYEKIEEDKRMSVRATVASHFEQVALEQKRKLAQLTDNLKLLESGLDSLSFALIVVRLEETLGFDPFDAPEEMSFPVTFGDFVKLYEYHKS